MKFRIIFLMLVFCWVKSKSQDSLLLKLSTYMDEFKNEATKEAGTTWGITFDIPILIATHDIVVTNRQIDSFKVYKTIFYGKSDEIKPGGQTSKKWKGIDWAAYSYPYYQFDDKKDRLTLFFHEAFHRNQPFIGLEGRWTQCKHLLHSDARSLLRLEYNALLKAMKEKDFKPYLTDALTFRAYRYSLYPNAYLEEQGSEMLEGLANYTGLKLGGYSMDEVYDILQKKFSCNSQMFAYFTGAAYGFILDKSSENWRKQINKNDNFLYFTQKIFNLQLPQNCKESLKKNRDQYNWQQISNEEKQLEKETKQQEKKYQKIFFSKPVLKLPMSICTGGFDMHSTIIFPMAEGKVFNGFTARGEWGVLKSKDEIFLGQDILIPSPFTIKGNLVEGAGWVITLNKNWTIKKVDERFWVVAEK